MRGESGLTASDVALLSGRNGNNDGFGDNGSWWVIIFLIFAFMGWGRNGNGFGGGSGSGATDNYVLASDFATIQRQLSDGFSDLTSQSRYIQNGLCDGFYNMNTSLLNGFAGVNNSIMTNGYETRNAIQGVSTQLADCCCTTQRAIDGVNYNMATNTCNITNNATQNTRDIIDAINCSYNNLHNEIVTNRMEDLKEANRMLTARNTSLELSASQNAQNTFLINQLRPTPVPAYQVANPYCCYTNNCCNSTII